jgi:hypothetical protein
MKKFFLLIAVLFIVIAGYAQTNVSGGIYNNTTWTLANSPYIVTDTIVVFPNVVLTIEPGVVVKFDSAMQMEIRQAKLVAVGTATDSITFTSNTLAPVRGSYSGIYLNGGALTSQFDFCNFIYASKGLYADVLDSVVVNHSGFNQNSAGLQFFGNGGNSKVAQISNCNFNDNNIGLDLETLGFAQIDHCNFTGNTDNGLILIDGFAASYFPRVDYCNFSNNGTGLLWYFLSSIFNHCHFYNNTNAMQETGILHNFFIYNNTMKNCLFDYNQTGGVLYHFFVDSCTAVHNQTGITSGACKMQNCIIDSNSIIGVASATDSIGNCKVRFNGTGIEASNSIIDGNTIEYNTGANVRTRTIGGGTTIRGNTIRHGSVGIDNELNSYVQILSATNNVIENNDTGIILNNSTSTINCNIICASTSYDLIYGAISNTDVGHNYWCTSDSASTEAVIYDGYDNVNFGLVAFMPLDTTCYIVLSANEITNNNSITIFPNPSFADATLHMANYLNDATLNMYNAFGQQVKQLNHLTGQAITLHRDNLAGGLYFIRLTENNNTSAFGKLILTSN